MKELEKILDVYAKNDSKHILNTSTKKIPEDIIKNLGKEITLENIESLVKKGFPIYRYYTQITLHGICSHLDDDRVGIYKALTLNKNQSLGIKWIAVDRQKKLEICRKLSFFGWRCENSSTNLYPFMMERFFTKIEAFNRCIEYREIAKRIDNNLFYGRYEVMIGEYLGAYYSIFNLYINGIYEKNVTKMIECIVGKDIDTIDQIIKEEEQKRHERFKKMELEMQEEDKKRKEYNDKKKEAILNTLKEQGWTEKISNEIPIGVIFCEIFEGFSGVSVRFLKMTNKTTMLVNQKGESLHRRMPMHYKDRKYKCFVKL